MSVFGADPPFRHVCIELIFSLCGFMSRDVSLFAVSCILNLPQLRTWWAKWIIWWLRIIGSDECLPPLWTSVVNDIHVIMFGSVTCSTQHWIEPRRSAQAAPFDISSSSVSFSPFLCSYLRCITSSNMLHCYLLFQMMKHAWDSYRQYGWGHNELKPLAKKGHSTNIFGRPDKLLSPTAVGAHWQFANTVVNHSRVDVNVCAHCLARS